MKATSKSCKSKASKTSRSSPMSSPLIDRWNTANEEVYDILVSATNVDFTGGSSSTAVITLGFDYKWFGTPFQKVCLSRFGYISISDSCDEDVGLIAFVRGLLDPSAGGSAGQYLVKSSTSSLKISFEDVKWTGGDGNVQAQVELFPNGDILICYGEGDTAGNEFTAGVQDSKRNDYPIEDPQFDGNQSTSVWPECQCWKFVMPLIGPPPS